LQLRAIFGAALLAWAIAASPSSAADAPKCVLLFEAGGTTTDNQKVNGFWGSVDLTVGDGAKTGLAAHGINASYHVATAQGSQARLAEVVAQLQATGCTKVIQVSRALQGGRGTQTLSYSVLVFHLDLKSAGTGAAYEVVADYRKQYDYPMTPEVMGKLKPTDIGTQIAADLDASNVLAEMKTGPAPKP
jgi:hypothetical protein